MTDEPRYEGQTTNRRISQSSLETMLRCGLKYQLDREVGHRMATVRMVVGTATAAAADRDAKAKMVFGAPLSLTDLVEVAAEEYSVETGRTDIDAKAFEIDRGKDDAVDAARTYGQQISPTIAAGDIVASESPVIAIIAEGIELAGTPDLVTIDAVRDLKTGQPWTAGRVDRSRQLTAYSLIYEAAYGRPPDRVAIDSISHDRGRWSATTIWSARTEDDRVRFVDAAMRACAAIDSGTYLPAAEGAWWCSKNWCPHWRRCPARPGGKD